MTKLRNKIMLVLLALCFVACMGIFVACGGDDKPEAKTVTYTVTVKMDNTAVEGVKVTVKKGTVSYQPKTTGSDGKVEFTLAESGDYTVELADLPENYEVPEGTSLSFPADRNLTVNIAEKFAYKVKLVNLDGSAFTAEGVTVGICDETGCKTPVAIDANGFARIEADKADYHVKVFNLPAGFAYECDEDGYSMYQTKQGTYIRQGNDNTYNTLTENNNTLEIKIYPVNVIDFAKLTPLTDEQAEEYQDVGFDFGGADVYKVEVAVPAKSSMYYTYTAQYDGKYTLYLRRESFESEVEAVKNPVFLLGNTDYSGRGWFSWNLDTRMTEDEVAYVNLTNTADTAETVELLIAMPTATVATMTGAGTQTVTIYKENAYAVVELKPEIGATFKATVQGETDAAIAYNKNEFDGYPYDYVFGDPDALETEVEFKFTEDRKGETVYIAVAAVSETAQYPVTLSVKIEKVRDLANIFNTVTTEDTLAKYNRPANKELVPVPFDGEYEVVKGNDGYYHYGEDGPIVMVLITGDLDLDRFSPGGSLVYMELSTQGRVNPYVVDVTDWEDQEDLTKGNTYDDYRMLLRGFKDYKYDNNNNPSVPNSDDILVEKYYANPDFVNEDGAYPLTDELIDILKIIAYQEQVSPLLPMVENYENLWMFACYYYDDYLEPDAIAGEYKFVKFMQYDEWEDRYYITKVGGEKYGWDEETNTETVSAYTDDDFKLVVDKRGKYTIYQKGFEGYDVANAGDGTWSKSEDDGTYSFIVPNFVENWDWDSEEPTVTYEDLVYTVMFDATTGRLALVSDQLIWIFQKGGANKLVNVYDDENFAAMLEVYDNNTFKLYEGYTQVASGTHKPNADGSQIAIAVTDKATGVTTVTVAYDDGAYEIAVDSNEYQIATEKAPNFILLTEDEGAMLKLYNGGAFKFFRKDGENFVQYAYGTVGGEDEENPEIEILEKHESVKDAQVAIDAGMDETTQQPKYNVVVKVTYTDNTEVEYVFDMLAVL